MHGKNDNSFFARLNKLKQVVYLVSSVFNKYFLCASAPLRFFINSNCSSAWAHKRKALATRFLPDCKCKIIFFLSPSERFPPLVLQTSPTFSAFLRFSPIFSEQWFSHLL